jgi:hypothetical protein
VNINVPSTQRFNESLSCEPGVGVFRRRITETFLKLLTIHCSGINQLSDALSCATCHRTNSHQHAFSSHYYPRPYHVSPIHRSCPILCRCDARPKLNDLWQNLYHYVVISSERYRFKFVKTFMQSAQTVNRGMMFLNVYRTLHDYQHTLGTGYDFFL